MADPGYEVVGCEPSAESLERKRFQYRSVHRSGSVTFSLEEHDYGRTETSFRVVARRVSVRGESPPSFHSGVTDALGS